MSDTVNKSELEYQVARATNEVAEGESKLRVAQHKLEKTLRTGKAAVDKLMAENEAECATCREEIRQAEAGLRTDRDYLKWKLADLERGFAA